MTIATYQTLKHQTSAGLDALVTTAIAGGAQPYGERFFNSGDGLHEQVVITETGVAGSGAVPGAVADYVAAT